MNGIVQHSETGTTPRSSMPLGLFLLLVGTVLVPSRDAHADVNNPIAIENRNPGTTAWQAGSNGQRQSDDVNGQILGYPSATSVSHGGSINFHVSVNPVQRRINGWEIEPYHGWRDGSSRGVGLACGGLGKGSGCAPGCQFTVAHCDERHGFGSEGKAWASAPVGGLGEHSDPGAGGLPAHALVEDELGRGCWGVIPLGLRQLLPQGRATAPAPRAGGVWARPGGPGSC